MDSEYSPVCSDIEDNEDEGNNLDAKGAVKETSDKQNISVMELLEECNRVDIEDTVHSEEEEIDRGLILFVYT